MSHTYTRILVHAIFSTKDRIPYLRHDSREEILNYMGGVLRSIGCEFLSIGGVDDHVHMSFRLGANISLAEAIGKVKGNSSKWIHDKRILERSFAWQRGYAGFSVSESKVRDLLRYISSQEEHHRKMSFQDEVRLLLTKNRIRFDEKYLWD